MRFGGLGLVGFFSGFSEGFSEGFSGFFRVFEGVLRGRKGLLSVLHEVVRVS